MTHRVAAPRSMGMINRLGDGWMKEQSDREREDNKLLVGLDSSVETQRRVEEGEEGRLGLNEAEKEEEEGEEGEVCFGTSAAAPTSLVASRVTGQC